MNTQKKYGSLTSSVDPNKLADTVEGIIKLVAGVALFFGFTEVSNGLNQIIQQIGVVMTAGYAFYGAAQMMFGLVRKVVVAIQAAWAVYRQTHTTGV